MINMLKQLKN